MADMLGCLAMTLRITVCPEPRGSRSHITARHSWLRSHHSLARIRNWGILTFGFFRARTPATCSGRDEQQLSEVAGRFSDLDDTISALKNDLHDKELPEGTRARRIRSSRRLKAVGNAS